MLESAQIFFGFGVDTTAFMCVISKLNEFQRSNKFLWLASSSLEQILVFLRDEVGVTNFKKVVTNMPF